MNNTENFKFTVFEHIVRGTRFYSGYSETPTSDSVKIVKHCKDMDEALAICEETAGMNWAYFFLDSINLK